MRQQLTLFPEELKRPTPTASEPCDDDGDLRVRIDPEIEKTLPLEMQYHPETYKVFDMSSSRIGDWGEKKVQAICLALGIEAYANISCVGLADLVIKSEDGLHMIDVKVANREQSAAGTYGWRQRHANRLQPGVYGVAVIPSAAGIYCRWYNHQRGSIQTPINPPGLRDLWLPSLSSYYRTVA